MFSHFIAWLTDEIGARNVDVLFAWFGLHWSYVLTMHAGNMRDRQTLTPYWIVHLAPPAVVGIVLDVLFNLVGGTILYLELPRLWAREIMFTIRTRRNANRTGDSWLDRYRRRMGQWWKRQLNAVQPGHV